MNGPPAATQHQRRSSLASDGRRLKVRVGDVAGRFTTWRNRVFLLLIAVYALVPFIRLHGQPLILLDILNRRFFLFGDTYNAQDAYLLFFLLAGGILFLFLVTAVVGRVWCGWACPQTVFLEGVFRRIERRLEGPRHEQLRLEAGPWTLQKVAVLGTKHGLYVAAALLVSHVFLSYFVSVESLRHWIFEDPHAHWTAFLWMGCISGALYLDFAWFREQTCLILCPYGRFQSVLNDDNTVTVGYDAARGEPRGRRGTPGAGDCVDCWRCVDVCPTGIDIREGLQLECVACASCVDACDDIMAKLGRAPGLVRYASLRELGGQARRVVRPRILVYLGLLLGLAVLGAGFFRARKPFEATLIRQQGLPFVLDHGRVRNQYFLHVVNKTRDAATFDLALVLPPGATAVVPVPVLTLASLADSREPVMVTLPRALWHGEFEVVARTTDRATGRTVESRLRFLGP